MAHSKIYSFSKEQIKEILSSAQTVKEALLKIGLQAKGNNYKTFKKLVIELQLETELEELRLRSKERLLLKTIDNTEVYIKAYTTLCDKYNELRDNLAKQFYEITKLESVDDIDEALTYSSNYESGYYFSLTEVVIKE